MNQLLVAEQARFNQVMALVAHVKELEAGMHYDGPMTSQPLYKTEEEEDLEWAAEAGISPDDLVRAHEVFKDIEYQ